MEEKIIEEKIGGFVFKIREDSFLIHFIFPIFTIMMKTKFLINYPWSLLIIACLLPLPYAIALGIISLALIMSGIKVKTYFQVNISDFRN